MPRFAFLSSILLVQLGLASQPVVADERIVGRSNGDTIVVTASGERFAGAISSLTYRGVQYIDTSDHGREMQSAIQLDGWGECLNPNEAGSYADGDGPASSSILESISSKNNVLTSQTRPAFWLAPGEVRKLPCNPHLDAPHDKVRVAQNRSRVSGFRFSRRTSFRGDSIPGLIDVEVEWYVPSDFHSSNTEASTAYLPPDFDVFMTYERSSRTLRRVTATSADTIDQHTRHPVIISQADGRHAMGAFAPDLMNGTKNGYMAYFYFGEDAHPTAKWSCVFGELNIHRGDVYKYSCPIAIGSVDEVLSAINAEDVPGVGVSTNIPVFRFFDGRHHILSTSFEEGASSGAHFEETAFHVYPTNDQGRRPLFRCIHSGAADAFISDDPDCEGGAEAGRIGFVATKPGDGRKELFRFFHPATKDYLVTVNSDEGRRNGYLVQKTIGYVP